MARRSADARLRRLLALVPWVVAGDGPTLDEVCARFGLSQDELVAELDLLFLCGVHPFTPDSLIDVLVADGRVWIRYADYLERPLRLTPEEGLALVAAGTALLAVPGSDAEGPLARGLAKLAGVLGVDPGEALDVDLGSAPEAVLEALRTAISARRQVEIDYYAYGRDERTRRVVDPHAVFAAEGSGTSAPTATWPGRHGASGSTVSAPSPCSTVRSTAATRSRPERCSNPRRVTRGSCSSSSHGPAGSVSGTRWRSASSSAAGVSG